MTRLRSVLAAPSPLLLVASLLFFSPFFRTIAVAEEGRGSITGGVRLDGSGKTVADVEIQLMFGSKSMSGRTDRDGKYLFGQLLPGKYTVRVVPPAGARAAGSGSVTVTVAIGNGTSVERVDFALAPIATPTPRPATTATLAPTVKVSPGLSLAPVINSPLSSTTPAKDNRPVASPVSLDFGPSGLRIGGSPTPTGARATATLEPTGSAPPLTPVVSGPPPRLVTSFAQLREAAGAVEASQLRAMTTEQSFLLGVPFRTQIDGTTFSLVNCGPASLAMVLAAFGLDVDPSSLRDYLNRLVGNYDPEQGTSLYTLARIAQEAGLNVFGPSGRGGYQSWTIDAIREQIRAGHPVITLTKYRRLPGHFGSVTDFDHYVVITGLAGEDFVYNDAAYATEYGYNLLITSAQLEQAWADSSIPRHAIAIGFGDNLRPLPTVPNRLIAESLRAPQGGEPPSSVSASVRPMRGPATERLREQALDSLGARSAVADGNEADFDAQASTRPPTAASNQPPITMPSERDRGQVLSEFEASADAAWMIRAQATGEAVSRDGDWHAWRSLGVSVASLLLIAGGLVLIVGGSYVGCRQRHQATCRDQARR